MYQDVIKIILKKIPVYFSHTQYSIYSHFFSPPNEEFAAIYLGHLKYEYIAKFSLRRFAIMTCTYKHFSSCKSIFTHLHVMVCFMYFFFLKLMPGSYINKIYILRDWIGDNNSFMQNLHPPIIYTEFGSCPVYWTV